MSHTETVQDRIVLAYKWVKHCWDRLWKLLLMMGNMKLWHKQRERSKSCSPMTASNIHRKAAEPQQQGKQEAARVTGKSLKRVPGIKCFAIAPSSTCCQTLQRKAQEIPVETNMRISYLVKHLGLIHTAWKLRGDCLYPWLVLKHQFKHYTESKISNFFWFSKIFFLSKGKKTEGIQCLRKKCLSLNSSLLLPKRNLVLTAA